MRGKEVLSRIFERLGFAGLPRPSGKLVWLHGASMGECMSSLALINKFIESGFNVLLTSGTRTSATVMMSKLPKGGYHQFIPLDVPLACKLFLNQHQPDIAIFVESELWPNLIDEVSKRGIPMYLASARMSDKSYKGWLKRPKMARNVLSKFNVVIPQTEDDLQRFSSLGATEITRPLNLKLTAKPLPVNEAKLDEIKHQANGRTIFLAASTHKGEEDIAIKAHRILAEKYNDLLTIIVPRHPERLPDITKLLAAENLDYAVRSKSQEVSSSTEIYIADTMGELGLFYKLASVAFIGGSFVDMGGHNTLEAAQHKCRVVQGPSFYNFSGITRMLHEFGVLSIVHSAEEMAATVAEILADGDHGKAYSLPDSEEILAEIYSVIIGPSAN